MPHPVVVVVVPPLVAGAAEGSPLDVPASSEPIGAPLDAPASGGAVPFGYTQAGAA